MKHYATVQTEYQDCLGGGIAKHENMLIFSGFCEISISITQYPCGFPAKIGLQPAWNMRLPFWKLLKTYTRAHRIIETLAIPTDCHVLHLAITRPGPDEIPGLQPSVPSLNADR